MSISSCLICKKKEIYEKDYDNHVLDFSLKGIIKLMAPYFHLIIPKSAERLKRVATRHLTLFRGKVKICKNCGYGMMAKIPSDRELNRYYSNQYWTERGTGEKVFKSRYKTNDRAINQVKFVLDNIEKNIAIKKVLEIGAAHASSSLLFRDLWLNNQIKLYVCESGKQWVNYYKNANIRLISDYFPFNEKITFDYIHTSHWLEHVSALNKVMSSIYKILNKNGHLFIEVPNTEHYYWNYPQTDTPHIHFFTCDSLIRLSENYGFTCVFIEEYGITFEDLHKGLPAMQYQNKKGSYIRALLKKKD